jgi:hypothetical protein
MKHTFAALTAICLVVCLAYAPRGEANSTHSIRADLPCPFGGGGFSSGNSWNPGTPSNPLNPNPGLLVGNTTPLITASATLIAGSNITDNNAGLELSTTGQTSQYDWYTNAIPSSGTCSPESFDAPGPVEQVIAYSLASGGFLSLAAGDTEVQFNYDPSVAGATGVASFTVGGVTYTSIGTTIPTEATKTNDFLFDASGKLLGAIGADTAGNPTLTAGVPTGWTASSGTVSAPELDPASGVAGLTLLLGGLAVLRGRQTMQISSFA